jgi:hypothetical protein
MVVVALLSHRLRIVNGSFGAAFLDLRAVENE